MHRNFLLNMTIETFLSKSMAPNGSETITVDRMRGQDQTDQFKVDGDPKTKAKSKRDHFLSQRVT